MLRKLRVAILLCALALMSTGAFAAHASAPRRTAQAVAKYKIAFVQGISTDAFYVTLAKGVSAACAQYGLPKPIIEGAPNNWGPQYQTPIFNAVVAQHPDFLLVAPTSQTAMVGPINAAAKAGIPIIEVDTYANDSVHLSYIASNNILGGSFAARALNQLLGGTGEVAIINTIPGVSTTDQRAQGFIQGLKNYPGLKYDGMQYTNDQKSVAAAKTAALLASHPNIKGIFAANELTGDGVSTAIKAAGKSGQVKLVEFDAEPGQVRSVADGTVDALIAQHPYEIGYTAVTFALLHLQGFDSAIQPLVKTPFTIITKSNLNDPKVQQAVYAF
jgi:ribose transport system substrate-binding protein